MSLIVYKNVEYVKTVCEYLRNATYGIGQE